jgi:hypothetical protein
LICGMWAPAPAVAPGALMCAPLVAGALCIGALRTPAPPLTGGA